MGSNRSPSPSPNPNPRALPLPLPLPLALPLLLPLPLALTLTVIRGTASTCDLLSFDLVRVRGRAWARVRGRVRVRVRGRVRVRWCRTLAQALTRWCTWAWACMTTRRPSCSSAAPG